MKSLHDPLSRIYMTSVAWLTCWCQWCCLGEFPPCPAEATCSEWQTGFWKKKKKCWTRPRTGLTHRCVHDAVVVCRDTWKSLSAVSVVYSHKGRVVAELHIQGYKRHLRFAWSRAAVHCSTFKTGFARKRCVSLPDTKPLKCLVFYSR